MGINEICAGSDGTWQGSSINNNTLSEKAVLRIFTRYGVFLRGGLMELTAPGPKLKGEIMEIEKRSTARSLRYDFTENEKTILAEEMARKITEAEDLIDQKKAVASEYTAGINLAQAEAQSKAKKLTSGFEMRQIDCEEILDYSKKKVMVIRLDTGEHVESRIMTNYELQQSLDLKETKE